MVEFIERLKKFVLNHKAECLFTCYFLPVLLASVASAAIGGNGYGIVLFYTLVIYCTFLLVPRIRYSVMHFSLYSPENVCFSKNVKVFFGGFLFSAFVLFFCFEGFLPGAFSYDSIIQLNQAVEGTYNDWHPVLHTLFAFKLPLVIFESVEMIVPFQLICFSLLMGCFSVVTYSLAGPCYTIFSIVMIVLSPFTLTHVMFPWKDVSFAMAAVACMLVAVKICFEKKEYDVKVWWIILLSVLIVCASIFRHNGLLFGFSLAIAMFFCLSKKKWFLLVGMVAAMFLTVKGPLYTALDVQKPGARVLETVGFPLSVIFNVAKECPECLDVETAAFVNDVIKDQPNWKENHDLGGFDSIKFKGKIDVLAIERTGRINIWKMMLKCSYRDPVHSVIAMGVLTAIVYGVEKHCDQYYSLYDNNHGLSYRGNRMIKDAVEKYSFLVSISPLKWGLCSIGATIIVMLAFLIFKAQLIDRDYIKKLFLCSPIFIYNFGTMLLLTGDEYRFFYVSLPICPLVVLVMAHQEKTISSGGSIAQE